VLQRLPAIQESQTLLINFTAKGILPQRPRAAAAPLKQQVSLFPGGLEFAEVRNILDEKIAPRRTPRCRGEHSESFSSKIE
jgi:hypothetical protein